MYRPYENQSARLSEVLIVQEAEPQNGGFVNLILRLSYPLGPYYNRLTFININDKRPKMYEHDVVRFFNLFISRYNHDNGLYLMFHP